jgi:hypothetical protein
MSKVKELWGRSKVIVIAIGVFVLVLILMGVGVLMGHLNEVSAERERVERLTNQYNEAVAYLEEGNYSRAISGFEMLSRDNFKDSQDMFVEASYRHVISAIEGGSNVPLNSFGNLTGDINAERRESIMRSAIEHERWESATRLINAEVSSGDDFSRVEGFELFELRVLYQEALDVIGDYVPWVSHSSTLDRIGSLPSLGGLVEADFEGARQLAV